MSNLHHRQKFTLSTTEAARALGISTRTLSRRMSELEYNIHYIDLGTPQRAMYRWDIEALYKYFGNPRHERF